MREREREENSELPFRTSRRITQKVERKKFKKIFSPSDDRVVHEQHALAREHRRHRVELAPHGPFAGPLVGHDKGAADVAVLDEPVILIFFRFFPGSF